MTREELRHIVDTSNLDEHGANIRLNDSIKELIIYVGKLVATDNDEVDLLIAHNDVIKAANDVLVLKAIKRHKSLYMD